jgi:hypothetical protein
VYPAHWTVGAAEMTLVVVDHARHPLSSSVSECERQASAGTDDGAARMSATTARIQIPDVRLTSTRSTSALPSGWHQYQAPSFDTVTDAEDDDISSTFSARTGRARRGVCSQTQTQAQEQQQYAMEQWGRKVGHVVATHTDGKWIVVGGDNNVLQVRLVVVATISQPTRPHVLLLLPLNHIEIEPHAVYPMHVTGLSPAPTQRAHVAHQHFLRAIAVRTHSWRRCSARHRRPVRQPREGRARVGMGSRGLWESWGVH